MKTTNKAALEEMFLNLIGFVSVCQSFSVFLSGHSYVDICSKIS